MRQRPVAQARTARAVQVTCLLAAHLAAWTGLAALLLQLVG